MRWKRLTAAMHSSDEADRARLQRELARLPRQFLWAGLHDDLWRMGVSMVEDLRGRDPGALAADYHRMTGAPADPVIEICFASIVRVLDGDAVEPIWRQLRAQATQQRLAIEASFRDGAAAQA